MNNETDFLEQLHDETQSTGIGAKQVAELSDIVKMEIEVNGIVCFITDIIVAPQGLKVEFVTQHPEREDEIRPHVEACIMKLISDQEKQQVCNSKSRFSRICSKIKSTLLR